MDRPGQPPPRGHRSRQNCTRSPCTKPQRKGTSKTSRHRVTVTLSRPSRTPRLRPPVSRRSTACLPPVVRPSPARPLARPAGDDGRSPAHPSWRAPVLQPILASVCVCVRAIPGAKAKINDRKLISLHACLVDREGQTIMHHLARRKPKERTPRVTIQRDCSWVAYTPPRLNGGP